MVNSSNNVLRIALPGFPRINDEDLFNTIGEHLHDFIGQAEADGAEVEVVAFRVPKRVKLIRPIE